MPRSPRTNAWPLDFDDDRSVTGADLSCITSRIGTSRGQATYLVRADLNADGTITGWDLSAVAAIVGTSCSP